MTEKKKFAKLNIERKMFKLIDNKEVEIKENETVYTGDEVVYKVILTNAGNVKAQDVEAQSYIPYGVLPYYIINKDLKRITKSFSKANKNSEENIEDESIIIKKDNEDLLVIIKNIEIKPQDTCVISIYGIIA